MTAEQEAIERLRALAENAGDSHDMYPAPTAHDIRALLDSHERMRLALERIRDEEPMTFVAVDIARAALEGSNE